MEGRGKGRHASGICTGEERLAKLMWFLMGRVAGLCQTVERGGGIFGSVHLTRGTGGSEVMKDT